MSVGEIISALALCASSFDDDNDHLLMLKSVDKIEVHYKYITIYFMDGNTPNIKVYKDGTFSCLDSERMDWHG